MEGDRANNTAQITLPLHPVSHSQYTAAYNPTPPEGGQNRQYIIFIAASIIKSYQISNKYYLL